MEGRLMVMMIAPKKKQPQELKVRSGRRLKISPIFAFEDERKVRATQEPIRESGSTRRYEQDGKRGQATAQNSQKTKRKHHAKDENQPGRCQAVPQDGLRQVQVRPRLQEPHPDEEGDQA
jgi:hypothetical protein